MEILVHKSLKQMHEQYAISLSSFADDSLLLSLILKKKGYSPFYQYVRKYVLRRRRFISSVTIRNQEIRKKLQIQNKKKTLYIPSLHFHTFKQNGRILECSILCVLFQLLRGVARLFLVLLFSPCTCTKITFSPCNSVLLLAGKNDSG